MIYIYSFISPHPIRANASKLSKKKNKETTTIVNPLCSSLCSTSIEAKQIRPRNWKTKLDQCPKYPEKRRNNCI